MTSYERQQQILTLLSERKTLNNEELQIIFNVSASTIRNDLSSLQNQKQLKRTHGGAVLYQENNSDLSFKHRQSKNQLEKSIICKQAASFLEDGQCIALDASSTALLFTKYLIKFTRLTIVTNGLYTAMALKDHPNLKVILIGGLVSCNSGSIEGILGKDIISKINIDTAFVSAHGFTLEEGLTDFNIYECEIKRLLVERASSIVGLLDYSKLEKHSTSSFAEASKVHTIITDDKIPIDVLQKYKQNNINVIVAK